MKQTIYTENAPKPIGPYSQAVMAEGKLMFISGQIGLKPDGTFAGDDIATQTRQAIENLKAISESVGANLNSIIKTSIYLKNIEDFNKVNEIYSEYFSTGKPARATYEVNRLPKDALIEIEAVLVLE